MKKPKKSDWLRLKHVNGACHLVAGFIEGIDFQAFVDDDKTYSATLYQIQIVGEAVYKISKDLKNQYEQIEWSKIEGSRHIIVHEYDEVDEQAIWRIATIHLPQLKSDIAPIIAILEADI